MHAAIERKPENGCEIQDSSCRRNSVMVRLKLVTTHAGEVDRASEGHQDGGAGLRALHTIQVAIGLVEPWAGSGHIVGGDS